MFSATRVGLWKWAPGWLALVVFEFSQTAILEGRYPPYSNQTTYISADANSFLLTGDLGPVTIRATVGEPDLVVVGDTYRAGGTASPGGKPGLECASDYSGHGGAVGVSDHTLTFVDRPRSFDIHALNSAAAALACIGIALLTARRQEVGI